MSIENYAVDLFGRKDDRNGRWQKTKWKLLIFPILFSIIGIYLIISTSPINEISIHNLIAKNVIIPIASFAGGWLLTLSFWLLWIKKFKRGIEFKGHTLFWNREGLSWAFALLCFAVFLQICAIWVDVKWDTTDIEGKHGLFTQAELEAMPEVKGTENGITQLRRQLSIGIMPFQVGEFVKVFFMIFFAKLLTDMSAKNQIRLCPQIFVLPFFAILPIGILTFIMPNKSMLIIYMLLLMLMLWVQKMSFAFRLFVMIIPVALVVLLLLGIANLSKDSDLVKNEYYIKRVWTFINEEDALKNATADEKKKIKGTMLQQDWALQALANGGTHGRGLDNGNLKYALPAAQNDFAFSILGEELGLFIVLPLAFAMIMFLLTCFWIPVNLKVTNYETRFAQNTAWGIAFIFSLNILIHILVNLRLLPNTGQPLSFVSSGATNLTVNFFLIGMLLQISSMKQERIG